MPLVLSNARIRTAMAIALLSAGVPSAAIAQERLADPTAPADGPDGDGGNGDHVMIGVGGAYMPKHLGSQGSRFQPLPAVDIKWGRIFVNFQDGIGANLIDGEHFTIGAGFVPLDGYRAKDVPDGVGKLSMGLGARGFVKARLSGFEATLGLTKVLTGNSQGMLADASLSYPIMATERLMLMPSIGTTWGSKKHNDRYFGITQAQSLASGLPQFNGKSGLIEAKAELGLHYRLSEKWMIGTIGGVSRLVGDVTDSPIVERKTRPFGIAFVGYSF